MDDVFLYLTTRGRTTGLPHRIEIWFVEEGGRYYLVAERRAESGWVKNILRDPSVALSVGTRAQPESSRTLVAAEARVLSDEADGEQAGRVRALMNSKYQWSDGLIVELSPR